MDDAAPALAAAAARGGELGLAIIEIATSAALIASFRREVRAIRRPHPAAHVHRGVDWFEIRRLRLDHLHDPPTARSALLAARAHLGELRPPG